MEPLHEPAPQEEPAGAAVLPLHELPQLPMVLQPVIVSPANKPATLSAASATRILPLSTTSLPPKVHGTDGGRTSDNNAPQSGSPHYKPP